RLLYHNTPAMASPAVSIALIVLILFAVFSALAWFLKDRVHNFARALLTHHQQKHESTSSTVTTAGEIA
ncbi:ubiquinone biosynthesis methyltransferase, partial [Fusarium albosuccineum]